MCCFADVKAKRKLLASLGRNKLIPCWKILYKTGRSWLTNYRYRSGWNFPANKRRPKRYDVNNPQGLHVYQSKRAISDYVVLGPETWVRVYGHVDDLIRVDGKGQAVFHRLMIYKKDWLAAGMAPSEAPATLFVSSSYST